MATWRRFGAARERAPVYVVPDEAAERLTGYRVHRGALASLCRKPLPPAGGAGRRRRRVVVLEDLVDHANVGAIFRCAAALGVDAVILSPRCADPLYRRAVKVSMGAVFAIPYARMTGWYDGLAGLRAAGFRLLALTPDQAARRSARPWPAERTALLLGTEGDGLSSRWLHEADQAVASRCTRRPCRRCRLAQRGRRRRHRVSPAGGCGPGPFGRMILIFMTARRTRPGPGLICYSTTFAEFRVLRVQSGWKPRGVARASAIRFGVCRV